jgi:peptidoglycan/LPS O-acetylase OafA/YrhL
MQKKIYFENLDGLRFVAALVVFFSHRMNRLVEFSNIKSNILAKIWDLAASGYVGVMLFFVLSGFLITYILLEEKELTGRINVRNFYFRRILRIWPLYFLVLAISFFVFPFLFHLTDMINSIPTRLPYYLSFLSNFDMRQGALFQNKEVWVMQGITWSVSVEEQFYLVWPLLFIFLKPRYYIGIFIVAICSSLLFRIYIRGDFFTMSFNTLSVIIDLAIGGLSAYLVLKYKGVKDFFSRIPPLVSVIVYIFGLAVIGCKDYIIAYIPYAGATIHLFYGIFFSYVILDQNYSPQSFLKLGRCKFFSYWGKRSYGLYLLHPVAIAIVVYGVKHLNIIETTFFNYGMIGLAALILSMAMSYLSYKFFEKGFLH